MSTSVSVASAAAITSGLPLKVPYWWTVPSATTAASSSVIPIAPPGKPPQVAFASVMMSGVTPKRCVAPPGEIVAPVLTSSKISLTPCSAVSSRTRSR